MGFGALIVALLTAGVVGGFLARRLPPSGKVALALALLPPAGLYYSLGAC